MSETTTEIKKENISSDDLDQLLGIPGAETAIVDDTKSRKPNVFANDKVDTTFLDEEIVDDETDDEITDDEVIDDEKQPNKNSKIKDDEIDDILEIEKDEKTQSNSGIVDITAELIEEGVLLPFEDDKDLSEYTAKDFKELFEENIKLKEQEVRKNTPKEFFEALPKELQYAAKYVAEGGTDLKGLFKNLAIVEETKSLSLENEEDQEVIIKEYLMATNFGDEDEIQEEIDTWRDLGVLDKKASKFKPKLDKMQEKVVEQKLKEQEAKRIKQEEATKIYTDTIYKTIEKGEINGLKLDPKIQNMLFSGLTQANYTSTSGNPTNLLGHLLEKHQFINPNHDLIAEALWLLADPESYKKTLQKKINKKVTEKTVRALKTEEANKNKPSSQDFKTPSRQKINRNKNRNFFER